MVCSDAKLAVGTNIPPNINKLNNSLFTFVLLTLIIVQIKNFSSSEYLDFYTFKKFHSLKFFNISADISVSKIVLGSKVAVFVAIFG